MELKHLETFLVLSRICNFTKAAQELNYAQSNVSSHIQKLEDELGFPLFDRMGRKVVLTKKGQELIPYAQKMVTLSQNAKQQLSEQWNSKILIAASESLCIYELPQLITHYQTENPNVELFLQMINTNNYEELLTYTGVDFAYVLDTLISHPLITNYATRMEAIGLFAHPNHPILNHASLTLEQLANERLILTSKSCCYRKQFEKLMDGIPFTIALETSSLQTIKELTLSGFGICLLPVMAAKKELETRKLIQLPISLNISVYSQLLLHKDKWISPEVHAFLELLTQ